MPSASLVIILIGIGYFFGLTTTALWYLWRRAATTPQIEEGQDQGQAAAREELVTEQMQRQLLAEVGALNQTMHASLRQLVGQIADQQHDINTQHIQIDRLLHRTRQRHAELTPGLVENDPRVFNTPAASRPSQQVTADHDNVRRMPIRGRFRNPKSSK